MSETEQILNEFQNQQGWSDITVLELALTYIDNQASPEAWRDYLTSLAEVDDDLEDPDIRALDKTQRERYYALVEHVGHDKALSDARKW